MDLARLRLETAQRLVSHEIATCPTDPDWTAYLQALMDAICDLSMHDGLTGLWNRRYFDNRLKKELQRAQREGHCCAVALIDVDYFKNVNDKHGHAAGDHVLRELASLMTDALRLSDEVTGRFGGEEFAIIMPGTHASGAKLAMNRLRTTVEAHLFRLGATTIPITVSVGVAVYDPGWSPMGPDQLLAGADAALYEAKGEGRNRVRLRGDLGAQPTTAVTREERDLLLPPQRRR